MNIFIGIIIVVAVVFVVVMAYAIGNAYGWLDGLRDSNRTHRLSKERAEIFADLSDQKDADGCYMTGWDRAYYQHLGYSSGRGKGFSEGCQLGDDQEWSRDGEINIGTIVRFTYVDRESNNTITGVGSVISISHTPSGIYYVVGKNSDIHDIILFERKHLEVMA